MYVHVPFYLHGMDEWIDGQMAAWELAHGCYLVQTGLFVESVS